MHLPGFPPDINEWLPPPPGSGPPLPRWMLNPKVSWLPYEERERLARRYGHYVVRRAEAFVPEAAGVQAVEATAKQMYVRIGGSMGLPPPGRPGPKGPRAKANVKDNDNENESEDEDENEDEDEEPTEKPIKKSALKPLTSNVSSDLSVSLNEFLVNSINQRLKIKPSELIPTIRQWSKDKGYAVDVDQAKKIVSKALGTLTPDQQSKYKNLTGS